MMQGVFPGEYVYDDEEYDYYRYDDKHILSRKHPGYTVADLHQQVTFLRPKGDTEGKDVCWCLDNDFREVKDGVWSGRWCTKYGYSSYPESDDHVHTELGRKRQVLLQRLGNVIDKNVDSSAFEMVLHLKNRGNAYFVRKDYLYAIQCYDRARKQLGIGELLAGAQTEELVKILSNQAECYLRLESYTEAGMCATEALALDGQHEKSLLRRAKASYRGAEHDSRGMINPGALGQIEDDLNRLIRLDGQGAKEAATMKEKIRQEVEQQIASMRGV